MDERQGLLDAFKGIKDALFACDERRIRELIAEEYIGYDPQGNPQDLQMTLEAYRPGGAVLDRYDVEEVETRVIGEVGIISGKGYIHGTFAGYEFEHDLRFMDIYVLRDSGWRLYMSQVTPLGKASEGG